ncbi:MAG: hypothetical protein ABWZ65_14650 [Pseudomonas mandelii]
MLAKEVFGIAADAGCYQIGAQAVAQLKTGTVKAPVFFGVVANINRYDQYGLLDPEEAALLNPFAL